jgi:hypothetical protein
MQESQVTGLHAEAAPMLDSFRHADAGNRAAGLLVDCLDFVVCSALV